jgi:hypothetical protein
MKTTLYCLLSGMVGFLLGAIISPRNWWLTFRIKQEHKVNETLLRQLDEIRRTKPNDPNNQTNTP